ncbi:hypothetical protein DTO217A2_4023 [Paecilomyces variotii]|nr:hypothetical protein DTO217A2_4023 [Paecilomyces variotii]
MKIVIIGAGISGCGAYLALKKHLPRPAPPAEDHTYTIYEAYDTAKDTTFRERPAHGDTHSSTLIVGGGLGVCPNGLGVLARLDESLVRDVVRAGYPVSHFKMQSSYGWELFRGSAAGSREPVMNTVSMSRHALWRCLRDRIPDDIIFNKRVSEVVANADGRNIVRFADGSPPIEADLVIGADGLKSTAKNALFQENTGDPYPPQYEGFVGVGGFVPVSPDIKTHVESGTMTFTLGGNGFFGYAFSSSSPDDPNRDSPSHVPEPGNTVMWWSTYSIPTSPDPKTINKDDISHQLRQRHHNWHDPVIQKIIESVTVESMYPVWTTPELPTWERDGVILLGDAAHALPPNSGQGASQALEDVESFSLFLSHYLRKAYRDPLPTQITTEKEAIKLAAKKHMDLRLPRVKSILQEAKRTQSRRRQMSLLEELIMYFAIWVTGLFANSKRASRERFDYNVAEEVERVLESEG